MAATISGAARVAREGQRMNNTPINLRICFKKVGSLQYISHLDLVRTMHKIIVRSKLPLWYTEGFNPKPKMVFAAPLSVGTESVVEIMDLRLSEKVESELAVAALNANMTDELSVLHAYYPSTPLTDMKWLSYRIRIKTAGADEALATACREALTSESVMISKKTKSGADTELNIRPLIKSVESAFCDGEIELFCILSSDPSSFLNPRYVIQYLSDRLGILKSENLLSESYSIMREGAFFADMTPFN